MRSHYLLQEDKLTESVELLIVHKLIQLADELESNIFTTGSLPTAAHQSGALPHHDAVNQTSNCSKAHRIRKSLLVGFGLLFGMLVVKNVLRRV
ncbi:unnamed protein product [Dicrocoelium dendriticum]|nr:unnamed protein product [Dicrocoelium dendriticum]